MAIKYTFRKIYIAAALCLCIPAWCAEPAVTQQVPEQTTVLTRIQEITDRASSLVTKAVDFLGTRYQRGGNNVEQGLDCSGLVRLVFKDAINVDLPRTAAEISRTGEKIDQSELQPGDLVFYNTLKRGFSHVGIYLGDNKFIHSPSKGGQVRIESMELAYWKKRFNGARRINDDSPQN
ncbi:cell wall-associated NlpC family hydrolase [Oxalobacteraceae bacterium GrIS 2.11]